MRQVIAVFAIAVLAGCASTHSTRADTSIVEPESAVNDINDLAQIEPVLAEMPARRTLLVLDIDDTLLTSAVFFGSDSWYEWQKHLAPDHPALVPCRFDVIGMNYEAGTQVLTQPNGPAIVAALTGDKLILTSRSWLYRGGTTRELAHAGFALPTSLAAGADGVIFPWPVSPTSTATVSYANGVFMVSGQNKGTLLLELLRRVEKKYERVVLVDDGPQNIEAMRVALKAAQVGYRGLHYTRVDKTVSPEDEEAALAGWTAWQTFLGKTFPERLARLQQKDCGY